MSSDALNNSMGLLFYNMSKVKGISRTTHGESKTELFKRWASMLARCKSNWKGRKNYFDRGIAVCDEWHSYLNFRDWAFNNGFDSSLELDRKDNNLGYYPENCRWITHSENMDNRRNTMYINYNGEKYPLSNLLRKLNVPPNRMRRVSIRLANRWSLDDAVNTPSDTGIRGVQIINTVNGKIYKSIKELGIEENISTHSLRSKLSGKLINNTVFKYKDSYTSNCSNITKLEKSLLYTI